ncbi:unnamed protein product, partial [Lymnaea stagnalis]
FKGKEVACYQPYRSFGRNKMCMMRTLKIFLLLFILNKFSFGQKIEMFEIRQEDSNTTCTSGFLSNIDRLFFNTTVTFRNELQNNSIVTFEIRPKTSNESQIVFALNFTSECIENKKTGNYYHCSKISDNAYNISIYSEVSEQFSEASIRGFIKNNNQTEMASDQMTLPKIFEPTDVTGILSVNEKNMTDKANCSFIIDKDHLIIEYICIAQASPCLVEISSNDSTKVEAGEKRVVFKRFLYQDVSLEVKIKYALCRLDFGYNTLECIVTRRGQLQKITMIIVLITGIPTALVLFFLIYSFFKMITNKRRSALIESDYEEAEPLNIN